MKDVFVVSDSLITPLGLSTYENFERIKQGEGAIKKHLTFGQSSHFLALLDSTGIHASFAGDNNTLTYFEKLCILVVSSALKTSEVSLQSKKILLILSTTKGNVDLLLSNSFSEERVYLHESAKRIQSYLKLANKPLIVSNACTSGVVALNTATELLISNMYETVIICGADLVSEFTLSGFESFKALSGQPCRPFDAQRDGTSLGEGAGAIVLSTKQKTNLRVLGGTSSNDANHISGPSRNGEGLHLSIRKTLNQHGAPKIDFISAHGTGTLFNDEMESKAFNLCGLEEVPINSLKGYYGHTFGAAGIIESVITLESMRQNKLICSKGFTSKNADVNLNILTSNRDQYLETCLKTASGFGGCNASILFQKIN